MLTGCAAYVNYPPQMDDVAVHDLGVAPTPRIMALAVERVARLWPVDGAYVVNFPRGTTLRTAERTVRLIEDPRASVVTSPLQGQPAFHVTRVWVRGGTATVDVVRPVLRAGASEDIGQQITLTLNSALGESWRVVRVRPWTVGAYGVPELRVPEGPPEAGAQAGGQP